MSSQAASRRQAAAGIVRALRTAGHEAYFVGGCVRDRIRGVEPGDYDVATSARPEEVTGLFERTVPVGEAFGVVLVVVGGQPYEVATYRTEGPYADGRRPERVEFADARADVMRRDFTVNGLLMDPETGEVIDRIGGRADIAARLVRTIGDPDERFAEDHLRMLRAVRFAASLGYEIEPATMEAIRRRAGAIRRMSAERIREELAKMLTRGGARRGMELLAETGLLGHVLPEAVPMAGCAQPPEFHPEGDVWEHTLGMLDLMPANQDARLAWAVVLHDIGKPQVRSIDADGKVHFYGHVAAGERAAGDVMRRLRFSRAEIETVLALVHNHMRFMHVTGMRQAKLKRFIRMPDFDLHLELHRLDCAASHGKLDNYEFVKGKLAELGEEDLRPPRLVTGHDLIEMGFAPGPLFAEILRAVEDAQLDGALSTTDEARKMVIARWGGERQASQGDAAAESPGGP